MKTTLVICALAATLGCSTAPAPAPEAKTPPPPPSAGSIDRMDAAFDALVPKDPVIEKVATGFTFTEGPLWRPEGTLWFSDVVGDVVREWNSTTGKVIDILNPAGNLPGVAKASEYGGPNGLAADKDGAVLIAQHSSGRIVRIDKDKKVTTVVDSYQGKRLNSPNDLVFHSNGALYFTDPPYGFAKQDADPAKKQKFNGVYRLKDGKVDLLVKDLTRPNGIAFSPDEKFLYVANSDDKNKVLMRYEVAADGTVSNGKVFLDVTAEAAPGAPDGLKVDTQGNVYTTGSGGIWVLNSDGKVLGKIKPTEVPTNCAWGDDGKSLYMTAFTSVYRIKLSATGKKELYQ